MKTEEIQFTDEDFSRTAPQALAVLMDLDNHPDHGAWQPQELGEILRHQLQAPLLFDLTAIAGMTDSSMDKNDEAAAVRSFGELFRHPSPPLPLLRLTKEFAKTSDRRPANPLPPEIAVVLYYAAIVTALLRHGERISRLSDEALGEGINWALRQAWLEDGLRILFETAHASM